LPHLRTLAAAALLLAGMALAGSASAGPRVMSLDQCSDEYILALAPRQDIVGLSYRADDGDSWMREKAAGLPLRRVTTESVLAARPDVVVRYWGGDARLSAALVRRGMRVVNIQEANDFGGIAGNVRTVAAALGEVAAGEAIVADMDRKLAAARNAWKGEKAVYVTPGGFTAGPGTLVDSIITATGLRNGIETPSYSALSLEKLVLSPPSAIILGFFDFFAQVNDRWGIGRHGAMQRVMAGRTVASLPGSELGCPGWFAADGAAALAAAAHKGLGR
jgi:iron complex transport system substrate-binding protein